mgnify:CR=1 FL=1
MEDIIFNGTENRKPLSFAEVSMIMDNSDKKLNLDLSGGNGYKACIPFRRKRLPFKRNKV